MNRPGMPVQTPASQRGFTLVELMVTVAIVGIMAAIAVPAYGQYLVKSSRGAAQSHLLELALAQTQYMADNRSYAGSVAELGMTTPAAVSGKYTIAIALLSAPARFTITATPPAGTRQAADGALSIDHAGAKLPSSKW